MKDIPYEEIFVIFKKDVEEKDIEVNAEKWMENKMNEMFDIAGKVGNNELTMYEAMEDDFFKLMYQRTEDHLNDWYAGLFYAGKN